MYIYVNLQVLQAKTHDTKVKQKEQWLSTVDKHGYIVKMSSQKVDTHRLFSSRCVADTRS